MNFFITHKFCEALVGIYHIESFLGHGGDARRTRLEELSSQEIAIVLGHLEALEKQSQTIGLGCSVDLIGRAKNLLRTDGTEKNFSSVQADIRNIREQVFSDLKQQTFAYIHPENKTICNNGELFGQSVAKAFPKIAKDARDAGNCVALELYTAAVFHLMRVSEEGLRRLAKKLKVKLTDKGRPQPLEAAVWSKLIAGCRKQIETARALSASPKKDARLRQYSELADHCEYMKDIWRNHISHGRAPYNEHDAKSAFERVRAFMVYLESIMIPAKRF